MASHLLSCSFTASPFSQKLPRQLPTYSPKCFTVSCAAGGSRRDGPHLDRRDMLLGMGGLYGSTNLAPAMAKPIPPPALDQCSTAKDLFQDTDVPFNCCPPVGPNPAPDYVLPKESRLRVRPALHKATPEYMEKYQRAVQAMKDLSVKDHDDPRGFTQQSHIHCAYCNLAYPQTPDSDKKLQIHFSWLFLPWHRWYLYFYERICAKLIGDPTFALPFWNWDNTDGMFIPQIYAEETTPLYNPNPLYDANRDTTHYNATVDLRYDGNPNPNPPDVIKDNNLKEMYVEMVQNGRILHSFYGGRYAVGSDQDMNMAGKLEAGSHTAVHRWVGQNDGAYGYDMGNFATAGNDMLFFSHHANIDRLWSVWRHMQDEKGRRKDFISRDWRDAKFVFYDEEAKLWTVSVKQCLNNEDMGFTWQHVENEWKHCKPKASVKRSGFAKISKAPKQSDIKFPVKLDKLLRVVVDRPKTRRSAEEKEEKEEILEISGIDVECSQFVRFEVFVNDGDAKHDKQISTAEYAGSYSQVPLTKAGRITNTFTLALTEVLEELDAEDDDQIVVSIVPKAGGEHVIIGGINIVYES